MNDTYVGALFSGSYLEHHGIKGMRWGVRKYQNEDGTLTDAGKKRYKTKTNFEKQTARDRRIRRNVVKGAKVAATAALTGYAAYKNFKRYAPFLGFSLALTPYATTSIGKQYIHKTLSDVKSYKNMGKSLKDYTMDDLKKLDLY